MQVEVARKSLGGRRMQVEVAWESLSSTLGALEASRFVICALGPTQGSISFRDLRFGTDSARTSGYQEA